MRGTRQPSVLVGVWHGGVVTAHGAPYCTSYAGQNLSTKRGCTFEDGVRQSETWYGVFIQTHACRRCQRTMCISLAFDRLPVSPDPGEGGHAAVDGAFVEPVAKGVRLAIAVRSGNC